MAAIVRVLLVILAAFQIGNSDAGWFGPSSYEECILDKMKDAKNSYAAAAIADACRRKFPLKEKSVSKPKIQGMPSDAVARITLACEEMQPIEASAGQKTVQQYMKEFERATSGHPNDINCAVHNGNSNWTVMNVVVRVREFGTVNSFDNDVRVSDDFGYGLSPLSTRDVRINGAMVTGKIRTSIISADGVAQ